MKKIVLIITILIILGIPTYFILNKDKDLTPEEAKKIAINDISNKNNDYVFNSVEYNLVNDTYIYTLEFTDKNNYYTYKINAKTKKIISSKVESLNNNKIYLKEGDILTIVYNHAKINRNESNLLSNEVILEDNMPIYVTVFYYNNIRYEYKTNAYTGAIISVSKINENKNG